MIAKYSQARPARRPATIRFIAVLAVGLLLAACGKEQPAETAATATPTTTAPAATPATAVSAKVTAMTADQLREAASKAYAENRLYAPAEDNAVEYYLALRDKSPGDAAAASSALGDLLPMTVIAIEQSVNRDDFSEANRLAALLEKADGQHPALARLKASIAAQQATAAQRAQQLSAEEEAKRLADLEKQRLADQKKQQEDAAKKLAAQEASQKQARRQGRCRQDGRGPGRRRARCRRQGRRRSPRRRAAYCGRRCSAGRVRSASDLDAGAEVPAGSTACGHVGLGAGRIHGRYRRHRHRRACGALQPEPRLRPRSGQRRAQVALPAGGFAGDHAA